MGGGLRETENQGKKRQVVEIDGVIKAMCEMAEWDDEWAEDSGGTSTPG